MTLLDALRSCLPCIPAKADDGECIFCDVSVENGFDIVYEDDDLIAFKDRWPRASEHLLLIPRGHVGSVHDLTVKDVPLLERMEAQAKALRPRDDIKLGFHVPPLNSIGHLHLHVLVPPFTALGKIQYPVNRRVDGGKGWSWFVTPRQAINILEAGGQVRVGTSPAKKADA